MKKRVVVLGSTGSIGTQCLSVCRAQNFKVVALAANSNLDLLEKQAREFLPSHVVTADESLLRDLKLRLRDLSIEVTAGAEAVERLAALFNVNLIVNAITGFAGLRATLAALKAKTPIALANKEALVVGGELVMNTARENATPILPIDSEHSAIWQSMRSGEEKEVKGIILTASGGPFFGKTRAELAKVTLSDALKHPNWTMGAKITIDSATLMNKGLEFIEAMQLFRLTPEQIQVVVHRESILHSAVEFIDHSVIAQLGTPDMRVAIQYAMTYPRRLALDVERLSLIDYGSLTFAKPDMEVFTCLKTAIDAAKKGGLAPALINGANEQAVELFLREKISFLDIGSLVALTLSENSVKGEVTLDNITQTDKLAREFVIKQVNLKSQNI